MSFRDIAILGAVVAYLLIRLSEHRQHLSNYRFIKFIEGEETSSTLMRTYYGLDYLLMLMVFVEFFVKKYQIVSFNIVVGATLLLVGGSLRYWAINSLDRLWSKRCIYVPGLKVLKSGPYKFFNHPEYLSRFLDGSGLCVLFGAYVSQAIFLIVSIILLQQIIKVESLHIAKLSREER